MKQILLYSGGMDSYIAWYLLDMPPTLFVNLKVRYWEKELQAVINTIPDTMIIECPQIGKYEEDDANVPLRNLYLIMFAANEKADIIWLIVQKDEMSIPDRSGNFLFNCNYFLSYLTKREIKIKTPFVDMDKTDMVRAYLSKGGDIEKLLKTVGCFSPEKGHCGDCGACFRRYVAFKNNGIDPGYELSDRIKKEYQDKLHTYSQERQERMSPWL